MEAKKFILENPNLTNEELLIKFAKYHLNEAIITIANGCINDLTTWSGNPYNGEGSDSLDIDKIEKVYPLSNIK